MARKKISDANVMKFFPEIPWGADVSTLPPGIYGAWGTTNAFPSGVAYSNETVLVTKCIDHNIAYYLSPIVKKMFGKIASGDWIQILPQ